VESLLEPGDLGESGGYVAQLGDRADADPDAEDVLAKRDAEAMFGDRRRDPGA
jgi:hypothetical protein